MTPTSRACGAGYDSIAAVHESDVGPKRTRDKRRSMSACWVRADLKIKSLHVGFGPEAEVVLPYSITSSARPSSESWIESPSAFAVLRLMISSTLVDCWTGRSTGLSPLSMRPTPQQIYVVSISGPTLGREPLSRRLVEVPAALLLSKRGGTYADFECSTAAVITFNRCCTRIGADWGRVYRRAVLFGSSAGRPCFNRVPKRS